MSVGVIPDDGGPIVAEIFAAQDEDGSLRKPTVNIASNLPDDLDDAAAAGLGRALTVAAEVLREITD